VALPVGEILSLANVLVDVSGRLMKSYKNRKRIAAPDPNADPKDQVHSLVEQLHQLEAVQEKQAELILQLTEQMQSVTQALAVQDQRTRRANWALAAALIALGVSVAVGWVTR